MKLRATSGGEGGQYELPPDDNHRAAIVAVVDLGTHMEAFGSEAAKPVRKVVVAYELLDAKKADGFRFVVGLAYRLSLHEKASFRKVAEAARGKLDNGADFDPASLLGHVVKLTIVHEGSGDKVYHKIDSITPADKKERGTKVKTESPCYAWFSEDGEDYIPHDWIPWTWHNGTGKRLPPEGHHKIAIVDGGDAPPPAQKPQRQPAGAGAGAAADPIKF